MDQSIVVVEENLRRSDTVASAPKSLGSVVQISSISIDISCATEDIESPKHDHFSIRGFVSGIRKKDWKACLPFGLDDNDEDFVGNLPPLPVPRFRWWHCSHCVPNTASERTILPLSGTSPHENPGEGNIRRTIGDRHKSRDSGYKDDSGPSNIMADSSIRLNEDPKAMACCSGAKTDVGGDEHGNMTEGNRIPVSASHQTDTDDSDAEHFRDASSDSESAAFCASPNRRKPKLRSLADIMHEDKNSTGEYSRAMSTSSSGMQLKSSEVEDDYDPQLHSDVVAMDVAEITKSRRKRKNSYKEDRGPSETTSVKKMKGTVGNAEKTCRRVEMSVPGYVRSDSQQNTKTHFLKPKKNKALDIGKKPRKTHAVQSANSQKHGVASVTDSGFTGPVPSTVVGSFLSNQLVDRIPHLVKGKWPLGEVNRSSLMLQSKNILGDRNIQRDVALDLSLKSQIGAERNADEQMSFRQHRIIPDLNESFTEKACMMQGKQLPTFSESRSSIPNRPLQTLASCSKEAAKEGKRKISNTTVEHGGAADDIPMEIVELLAMNQRERALGNSMHHLPPEPGISNSNRGPPTVYADGRPGMFTFPFPNTTSSISFASADGGVHPDILNFPRTKTCHPDDNRFRPFNSFAPNGQRKPLYSASSPVMPGPRPSKGSDLLWPPRSKNVPFHLNVPPNSSVRPNAFGGQPFPDHFYKGKTVSEFKGKGKIARETPPGLKEGRICSTLQPVGSLDAYSNDTIPAMQLLSLMDRGITSGSSFTVGKSSFLDKPFSPCSHHPRNENLSNPFLGASLFPHSKDVPVLNGICCTGESSKRSHLGARMGREQEHSKGIPFHIHSKTSVQPPRDDIPLGVCTLNRNPADFTTPDAGSKYTISANDLKPRRKNTPRERDRSHLRNGEGQKRQRVARQESSGKRYSTK